MNEEIFGTDDTMDTDGFFFSHTLTGVTNTQTMPYDSTIDVVVMGIRNFLAGCGFADESIKEYFIEQ